MKIATKLVGISCVSAVIVSAIGAVLLLQVRAQANDYDHLLQGPVSAAAAARQTEIDFNKQTQEWNDTFLGGHNPEQLAEHHRAFQQRESGVDAEARALADKLQDPASKRLLNEFLSENADLSVQCETAYQAYLNGNRAVGAANQLLRSSNRPLTDLVDQVVVRLNAQVAALTAAQRARTTHHLQLLLIAAAIALLVDSYFYCTVLFGVFRRLGGLKVVLDHLANADIHGLSIDISGNDEIGDLGESMKGVAAAIEELLAMHAH